MSKALAALDAAALGMRAKDDEEKVEPSAAWLAMIALPRPSQEVPLPRLIPGTDEPCGFIKIWPLTQGEQMSANAEADRFTKALMKDPQRKEEANLGYHHTYTNEVAIQVLFRACRDKDKIERPAFPSPTLLRDKLTTDEVGVLFSNYCSVQHELGPIRAYMTREETDALILRLAEGGSAFPLDSYSWEQQRTLLVSMASRLASCWTAMSSAGLRPDASTFVLELLAERDVERAGASDEPDEDEAEEDPSTRVDAAEPAEPETTK
jgi:hypothetical protein